MHFIRSAVLFILTLSFSNLFAQPSSSFYFLKYNQTQGLGGSSIYGLSQDEKGYIWVGTNAGLFRFDGTTFRKCFEEQPLPSQVIDRIFYMGKDSHIVFGKMPSGLYTIKGNTWKAHGWERLKGSVNYFSQSPTDRSIALTTFHGLGQLQGNKVVPLLQKSESERNFYLSCYSFSKDSFFVSREKNAFLLGRDTTMIPGLDHITCFRDFEDSCVLFGADYLYSYKKGRLKQLTALPSGANNVRYALQDHKGRLWFSGLSKGLFVMEQGKITEISASIGLDGDYVTYLFRDQSSNIWVSTESSGLLCFPKSIFTNYDIVDGLVSRKVTDMSIWHGNLIVGTSGGLCQFSEKEILGGQSLASSWGVCDENRLSFDQYIFSISQSESKLCIGSSRFDRNRYQCEKYPIYTHERSMTIFSGDTVFTAGWGRITANYFKSSEVHHFNRGIANPEKPTKDHFLYRLPNKHFWVGRSQGLYEVDSKRENITQVDVDGQRGSMHFFDIEEDGNDGFWFGTSDGIYFRNSSGDWDQWREEDGLISNAVSAVEIDNSGNLWLGTNEGLNVFDGEKFSSFTQGSGLISNDITALTYSDITNVLWIGTKKGVSKLDLNQKIPMGEPSFPLYIDRLEIVGDTQFTRELNGLPKLTLKQNNLRIYFSSINYVNPSSISYQYRLFPGDSSWRNTSLNFAEYLALGAKKYSFEVRNRTPGKSWGKIARINFVITPPFWKTTSFAWGLMAFILTLGALVFRQRVRVVRQRERKKNLMIQKINHLEQQALSLSMNPHFIFNSLNSIQHYLSEIKNREATKYISNFAKLIRLNMDSSKKRTIALNNEVERLALYLSLEKVRFEKEFNYEIMVDPTLIDQNPEIPNMVIQPLIENGIWHGILPSRKPGSIIVKIDDIEQTGLKITVTDNGVGLTRAKQNARKGHTSQGLSLTRQRLQYLSENNYLKLEELF